MRQVDKSSNDRISSDGAGCRGNAGVRRGDIVAVLDAQDGAGKQRVRITIETRLMLSAVTLNGAGVTVRVPLVTIRL